MDIADATTQMQILLGDDVFGRLSFADENWCLEQSRIGDDYDPWIAASEAAYLLGGRARAGHPAADRRRNPGLSWTRGGNR